MIHFDVVNQEKKLRLLEEQTMNNDFWNDTENSSKILKEMNGLKAKVEGFNKIQNELNNILEMSELLQLEPDEEMAKEVIKSTSIVEKQIEKLTTMNVQQVTIVAKGIHMPDPEEMKKLNEAQDEEK